MMTNHIKGLIFVAAALAAASGCAETQANGLGGAGGVSVSTSTGGTTTGGGSAGGGGGGAAPCDPAADHASDALNCGACGHDCLGGACADGQCQPIALYAGHPAPPLFLDDQSVYWTRWLRMEEHACPLLGLVRAPKLTAPVQNPEIVAKQAGFVDAWVKDGYAYYGADGCVDFYRTAYRFPVDAASPTIETVASFDIGGGGIAPGANALYALVASASAVPVPYDVVSMPLDGGAMTTLATNQVGAVALVTDDVNLYWTLNGDILSLPIAGGTPTTLISGASLQASLGTWFTADGALYYTAVGSPTMTVWRLPLGDAPPGQMIWQSDSGGLYGIVDSGDDVCFVFDFVPPMEVQSIVCAAKDGSESGAGRVVYPSALGVGIDALVADDRALYWIQTDGNVTSNARVTLQRLVK
jgi:hypothetical protein